MVEDAVHITNRIYTTGCELAVTSADPGYTNSANTTKNGIIIPGFPLAVKGL